MIVMHYLLKNMLLNIAKVYLLRLMEFMILDM